MPLYNPHGPVHEATEFWYDTEEKALLYEVSIDGTGTRATADHTSAQERGYLPGIYPFDHRHDHHEPHGISFVDPEKTEHQQEANSVNTQLVIRLWHQVEYKDQPRRARRREPLLNVPKPLAIFLAARRNDMHKEESLMQAIALLQAYIAAKGT